MIGIALGGIGVCAPGMADWQEARTLLRSPEAQPSDRFPKVAPSWLPAIERRRANTTSRLAVAAAMQAVRDLPLAEVARMPTVFSSADGDGEVLTTMLAALAQPKVALSPTLFHNSVFNAPPGYWGLAAQSNASSTAVSAGDASFAAGLREVHAQIIATQAPVLYIACDVTRSIVFRDASTAPAPFACALRLLPADAAQPAGGQYLDGWSIDMDEDGANAERMINLPGSFAGNPSAMALRLLAAVANEKAAVIRLPYLDNSWLTIRYFP